MPRRATVARRNPAGLPCLGRPGRAGMNTAFVPIRLLALGLAFPAQDGDTAARTAPSARAILPWAFRPRQSSHPECRAPEIWAV